MHVVRTSVSGRICREHYKQKKTYRPILNRHWLIGKQERNTLLLSFFEQRMKLSALRDFSIFPPRINGWKSVGLGCIHHFGVQLLILSVSTCYYLTALNNYSSNASKLKPVMKISNLKKLLNGLVPKKKGFYVII